MKSICFFQRICVLFLLAFLCSVIVKAQSTAFTYQGRLTDSTMPQGNGSYTMKFRLYDSASAGNQVGSEENSLVTVNNGVFTVNLDFSSAPFDGGQPRWLEIQVGNITLSPRVKLASVPYAVRAINAGSADSLSSNCVGCVTPDKLAPGTVNPKKIALFRWYEANQTLGNYFLSCGGASSIGFDGDSIWAGCLNSSIFKVRADDFGGYTSFSTAGGYGFAYDGLAMWVTAFNQVYRFRASDGSSHGSVSGAFSQPRGIAFDGTDMWVTNFGAGNVIRIRVPNAISQGTVTVGANPQWIAFDGTYMWVANTGATTISRIKTSDSSVTTFTLAATPRGIAFDGSNIWVAIGTGTAAGSVVKIKPSDGSVLGTYAVGNNPQAVAFDGANIWIANFSSNNVTKLKASDGSFIGNYNSGNGPYGLGFDGVNMWVANQTSGNIQKL